MCLSRSTHNLTLAAALNNACMQESESSEVTEELAGKQKAATLHAVLLTSRIHPILVAFLQSDFFSCTPMPIKIG